MELCCEQSDESDYTMKICVSVQEIMCFRLFWANFFLSSGVNAALLYFQQHTSLFLQGSSDFLNRSKIEHSLEPETAFPRDELGGIHQILSRCHKCKPLCLICTGSFQRMPHVMLRQAFKETTRTAEKLSYAEMCLPLLVNYKDKLDHGSPFGIVDVYYTRLMRIIASVMPGTLIQS